MPDKFRGLRKVVMVTVVEGNGVDIPMREVHYIYDLEQHGGSHGGMVGKIDTREQIDNSNGAALRRPVGGLGAIKQP